jgi:DNA-binding GntR family transcriptional regulator
MDSAPPTPTETDRRMGTTDDLTPTRNIVDALTRAIVEHRLHPGTKLAEQKLADHFGVSRTLVRQALFQLVQKKLIRMEPARGAFVATPSADEAKQVFATRRMLELEMTRAIVRGRTPDLIAALKSHAAQERVAIQRGDVAGRTELLGDFHVHMAKLLGNQVLAQILNELISRCALITLMYQSSRAAEHSTDEHVALIAAIEKGDEDLAVRLMDEHLSHVESSLTLDRKVPSNDISMALT